MTIEQCKGLHKGDKVTVSLGNDWYQEATFIRLIQVTSYGTHTFDDLVKDRIDYTKGRTEWMAEVMYPNDNYRVRTIRPRKLRRAWM